MLVVQIFKTWYVFVVGSFHLFSNISFICEVINLSNILLVQVKDALKAYIGVDEDHRSFTLIHCWHALKDEDKWKSLRIELAQKNKNKRLPRNPRQAMYKRATMVKCKRLQP